MKMITRLKDFFTVRLAHESGARTCCSCVAALITAINKIFKKNKKNSI